MKIFAGLTGGICTVLCLMATAAPGYAKNTDSHSALPPDAGSSRATATEDISPAARKDFQTLQASRYFSGYFPLREARDAPWTRQGIAEAIAHLLRDIPEKKPFFDEGHELVRRLSYELEPEMLMQGISRDEVRRTLASLHIPSDFWGYQGLDMLQRKPIRIGDAKSQESPTISRREFAQQTLRLIARANDTPPDRRYYLNYLARYFEEELLLLSTDVAALRVKTEIYRFGTPFLDVPAEHWAYPAVETVRRAGILKGYPGGTFHAYPVKK